MDTAILWVPSKEDESSALFSSWFTRLHPGQATGPGTRLLQNKNGKPEESGKQLNEQRARRNCLEEVEGLKRAQWMRVGGGGLRIPMELAFLFVLARMSGQRTRPWRCR